MNLGERIYRFRTEKNLSQGDLADRLDVSRQSISKWENNNAVPDLEKIIKLSEIFEVSLDELVKGEITVKKVEEEPIDDILSKKNKQETSKPLGSITLKQWESLETLKSLLLKRDRGQI